MTSFIEEPVIKVALRVEFSTSTPPCRVYTLSYTKSIVTLDKLRRILLLVCVIISRPCIAFKGPSFVQCMLSYQSMHACPSLN